MSGDLGAIWAIVRKDIAVWLRQPSAVAATLLPALSLIVVLYIGAAAVGRNPVALVVEGTGPHAQELATILEQSEAFNVSVLSADQATAALDSLKVAAVITVPPDFDQAFADRQPDPVQIQINNLNLDFTNDLRRSLPAAITDFYGQLPDGNNPIAVHVEETDFRQQDVSLLQFDLIPNLVLLLTIAGAINAGLATAREWEDQTIKELLLAPVQRGSLIIGKLLAGWLTTLVIAAIVLATEDLGHDLAVLAGTAVVMLAVAVASLRRRLTA
ncbi:MAG: ABC transporter permease [Chloroflexi bacterium]|nr:ABC transporter permease [Chloroflexota bacterium]